MKILKYIKIVSNSLFKKSILSKKFVSHNISSWKNYNSDTTQGIILLDYIKSFENEIPRTYFLNTISKKYKAKLCVFSDKKSILFNIEWMRNYKSFNVNKFIYIYFNKFFFKLFFSFSKKYQINSIIQNMFESIETKMDIMNLKYKDIEIGREIYAEYLLRFRLPTVNIKDLRLKKIIKEAIFVIEYWVDFFKTNNVKAVSLSHPNVRFLALVGKVANLNLIPVYGVTNTYIRKYFNLNDHFNFIRDEYFKNKNDFAKLSNLDKKNAIEWSKNRLQLRLSGNIGVDMHYTNQSAFHSEIKKRALKKTNLKKVLICSHEFFDDPNYTGGLLFPDFLEWLNFLGNYSKSSKYEWYLKNHPDTDEWTKKITSEFLNNCKHITLIDEKTSFLQLKEEGLKYIFTAHGTVGHECPLLGINVINADLNHPHMAYNFNVSPSNTNELRDIIINLDKLDLTVNHEEIYEYYYTTKKMNTNDSFIFKSYNDAKINERDKKINMLDIFLNQLDKKKHFEIIETMKGFI